MSFELIAASCEWTRRQQRLGVLVGYGVGAEIASPRLSPMARNEEM
jgi:hypothetical protein